jgi:heme-degrading monooxygenase HmoA
MIIVHDIFICKPGNASKLAKLFKEAMAGMEELDCIMTDMTGQYNRVIMVSKYESLTAYEKSFEKYMHDTEEMRKMKEMMKGYHEMYLSGSSDEITDAFTSARGITWSELISGQDNYRMKNLNLYLLILTLVTTISDF